MSKLSEATNEVLFQGVSVNEFDEGFDFAPLQAAGVGAVIARATVGDDYVDAALEANAEAARQANLRLGFYHYLTAEDEEAAHSQAAFFCKETEGFNAALRPALRVSIADRAAFENTARAAAVFLQDVERLTGIAPALYTEAEQAALPWSRSIAEKYPLWVIDEGAAELPQSGVAPWKGWAGWQYGRLESAEEGKQALALSRFTPKMLSAQIVLPETNERAAGKRRKLICVTVAYGDTLSAIARLFGTTVSEIVRMNRISNPNLIFPGQRLYLWVDASTPYRCCDRYTVRRGDTLSGIAQRFSLNWRRIAAINEIANPNLIYVGQEIKLGACDVSGARAEGFGAGSSEGD